MEIIIFLIIVISIAWGIRTYKPGIWSKVKEFFRP